MIDTLKTHSFNALKGAGLLLLLAIAVAGCALGAIVGGAILR